MSTSEADFEDDALPTITGHEFHTIRIALGMSTSEFARALGFSGAHASTQIRRYERGEEEGGRRVPAWIARLAQMYRRFGVPEEWQ